jgi:hypothetical protein
LGGLEQQFGLLYPSSKQGFRMEREVHSRSTSTPAKDFPTPGALIDKYGGGSPQECFSRRF